MEVAVADLDVQVIEEAHGAAGDVFNLYSLHPAVGAEGHRDRPILVLRVDGQVLHPGIGQIAAVPIEHLGRKASQMRGVDRSIEGHLLAAHRFHLCDLHQRAWHRVGAVGAEVQAVTARAVVHAHADVPFIAGRAHQRHVPSGRDSRVVELIENHGLPDMQPTRVGDGDGGGPLVVAGDPVHGVQGILPGPCPGRGRNVDARALDDFGGGGARATQDDGVLDPDGALEQVCPGREHHHLIVRACVDGTLDGRGRVGLAVAVLRGVHGGAHRGAARNAARPVGLHHPGVGPVGHPIRKQHARAGAARAAAGTAGDRTAACAAAGTAGHRTATSGWRAARASHTAGTSSIAGIRDAACAAAGGTPAAGLSCYARLSTGLRPARAPG